MDEVSKFLAETGMAGNDKVTLSAGGKSVTLKAVDLWRAVALTKDRETDSDRRTAMLAIVKEYPDKVSAVTDVGSVLAATVVHARMKDTGDDILIEFVRNQIRNCRAFVTTGMRR